MSYRNNFTLLFTLLFISCSPLFSQVIIFSEDFSTASGATPPSGWTSVQTSGLSSEIWRFDNPGFRGINSPISGTFAMFDSDYYGSNSSAEEVALVSPVIDLSSSGPVTLRFDHYFLAGYGGEYYVEVYNGSTWTTVASGSASSTANAASESIDISAASGNSASSQVRFRWKGDYSYYWAFDNVQLTTELDTDGDGIADSADLDDDNDGIPDLWEAGVTCEEAIVLVGGSLGRIYQTNLNTGLTSLYTTSNLVTGSINCLAANADAGVLYYASGSSIYVFNPNTGTHSLVQDLTGLISGGYLESGGASYYLGNLYVGTEDMNGDIVNVYQIPLAADGLSFSSNPVALGITNSPGGFGDLILSYVGTTGTIYGSTTGEQMWSYDLSTSTYTLINSSASVFQLAVDFRGQLWGASGTSLNKLDDSGNPYGSTFTLLEAAVDMTGPFNCPQPNYNLDSDGDGVPNYLDLDSDNDGIPDIIESGGVDTNGDGRVDGVGVSGWDADGDGLAGVYDTDDGGDNITFGDLDGDGLRNYIDIDADNDGILDIVEADGPSADTNGDGYVDDYNPGTGIFGGSGDADGDGYSNEYDSDTNNDGTIDNAQSLSGSNWTSGPLVLTGIDANADGVPDSYGNGDTDSDSHPDFLDYDADNDGILDNMEAQATGQSGTQAYVPNVSTVDSKGVPTAYSSYTNYDTDNSSSLGNSYGITPYDHDGDGIPDYKDTDSDNDGDPDVDEAWDSNTDGNGASDYSCTSDVDKDGLLSCFDINDADYTAGTHANDPPVDNGFEAGAGAGNTAASSFSSLNGTSVFYYNVFPNNAGDNSDIQPDWRDDNSGCTIGAGLQYPITGTDAIYNGSSHNDNPSAISGSIRASDYCEGLVEAGWKYYFDPINPTKVLFSIEHGANTTQIEYIELRRDLSATRNVMVGNSGFFVMARDWYVQTVDDAPLTANVNIRFYYDPADSTSMMTVADSFATAKGIGVGDPVWFKVDNQFTNLSIDASDGLSNATGYIAMTAGSYGAEDGLHYVQFDNITGFSGGGLGVGASSSFPVEWLDFKAELSTLGTDLTWSTAQEINSDYFTVERSWDGRSYEALGKVSAAGNSEKINTYSFTDLSQYQREDVQIYYRLKQVDIDGQFEYSKVLKVNLEGETQMYLNVYPNPAKDKIHVQFKAMEAGTLKLRLRSSLGNIVKSKAWEYLGGTDEVLLDLAKLPTGIYHLELEDQLHHSLVKTVFVQ